MFKLVTMIAVVAAIAGCSSSDSAPSAESTTASASYTGSASVCADLQTIADADERTRDPAAQSWEQQRAVILDGRNSGLDAFDRAIGDAESVRDATLADDLEAVRAFTVDTIEAVRSSTNFDDFSAQIQALDSTAAAAAGERLNDYSIATCGFPLIADGP
ncbi:hypothetical protein GCM10007304_20180 [Rhodococcoides trifolii]|uniref:Lipoprotein n=1 Tax=Rhodococcoides trifolii TaxID=908250 RepID=A0A917D1G5_9NOCA|nr:hypothetical protein [Rhodococcus trifolii]GGG06044.1 hypothetical protein GCM10007304_20180 [Rhodococcus trifolii]